MRAKANRRLNREPVRSPSPDIANRNIITHTTAPDMRQVLSKSRSKEPQVENIYLSSQSEEIQRALAEAHEKIRQLEMKLTALLIQNSGLKKEIIQLKENLNKSKYSAIRPFDQSHTEVNLKEYEARIGRFSQEIKRIHDLLLKEKQKNEQLQSQNQHLKNYDPKYSARYSKSSSHHEVPATSLHFIQQTLNANFDKIKAEHDLKIHLSLNALAQRLAKVERNQSIIQNKLSRPEHRTPISHKQFDKYDFSTAGGYPSASRDPKKFYQTARHTEDERELDLLRDKVRVNQLQIDMLKRQNSNLGYQLQRQKDRSFTSECPNCKICLKKISELQKQIQHLMLLRGQNKLYQQRINQLQQDNRELKQIKQQNQFYLSKLQELERQNQKLKDLQEQDYEKSMRLRYEKEKNQNNLTLSLQEYLRRVKDVKSILSKEQFRSFLQKVNSLANQNINLQSKLDQLLDEKSKSNRQGKGKELQLKKQVGQLTRQNQLLKTEIQELQDSVKQLKGIIDQYIRDQQKESTHYGNHSHRIQHVQLDTSKFQSYIAEAISRLESMQQSMASKINQA